MMSSSFIKQILDDHMAIGVKLLFVFMCIYLISTAADGPLIKMVVLCLALFAIVVFVKTIHQSLLWYIFLALLLFDLLSNYFAMANHHFLLIYMTILMIQYFKNESLVQTTTNIRYLVVIVLLFSSIQKLLSPQFVTGDFYYYMMNTGKFFKPMIRFNQEIVDITVKNYSEILALEKTNPNALKSVALQDTVPNLHSISMFFAWFTIAFEFIVAILFFWKPKHIITHLLFILLIIGIFITRLENGFLALLAISGFWTVENRIFRAIYLCLTILFMALIISKIGFY